MIDRFIDDSSVAIAWVVPSQSNQSTERLLEDVGQGAQLVVPVLWLFEVANGLIMLKRRRRLTEDDCAQAYYGLHRLSPLVDDEGQREAFRKISELAEAYLLSVYDAVFLELAIRREMPLASRDAALNRACKRAGVRALL